MPFHIFLSQSLSLATGGLEAWKIGKDVFLAVAVLFTICLVFWRKQGSRAFWVLCGLSLAYALLHLVVWGANPDIYGRSAILGLVMNLRVPAFAVLGYGAYILLLSTRQTKVPSKFVFSSLTKLVLGVSTVVVILGLVQYVLPKDVLTHVGYNLDRGVRPAFFIDDNPAFPRIMSTLREPNALAAYLLVPISLIASLLTSKQLRRPQWLVLAALGGLHIAALYLTFSRSALAGLVICLGLVYGWRYQQTVTAGLRRWWPVALVSLAVIGAVGFGLRNNQQLQGVVSHSTPDSAGTNDLDSNDYHWLYIQRGVEGIVDRPFGHGPGTAGLASIQNPHGGLLTENYYVQIGYETGILGLLWFVGLQVFIYCRLHRQPSTPLRNALLVSFWAYICINMLLHSWGNEAVAAGWWLLAGMVMAAPGGAGLDGKRQMEGAAHKPRLNGA